MRPGSDLHAKEARAPGRGLFVFLAVVALSRAAFLPGIPWEQDEALFAAGSYRLDLLVHHPHPPGFPLWIATGKAALAVLGDPLLGLQIASAVASVALAGLLAVLWGRWLGPRPGLAAAALASFLPGTWFHAPRAFTTTPALALAAGAAAVWLRPGRRAALGGWTLLALALLVRPILLPSLLALGLAAAWLRRDSLGNTIAGVALCGGIVAAGFVPVIVDTGGIGPWFQALVGHGTMWGDAMGRHLATWDIPGLGVVRAAGGSGPALLLLLLAGLGWGELRRRAPRAAAAWPAVTGVTALWILLGHNHTYPRYTLPLLFLLAGPAVAGLIRLVHSERAGTLLAWAGTAAAAAGTLPAMAALATEPFPPLAALAAAQRETGSRAVVVERGTNPFMDLMVLAGRGTRPFFWRPALSDGRQDPWALPGRWSYVVSQGVPSRLVPAAGGSPRVFSVRSGAIRRLSQGRFMSAAVARRGGIVLRGPSPGIPGRLPLREPVEILAQPAPPGSLLGLRLEVTGRRASLLVLADRSEPVAYRELDPGTVTLFLPVASTRRGRPLLVTLQPGLPEGSRLVLTRFWLETPSGLDDPPAIEPRDLPSGLDGRLAGEGFHNMERLGTPPLEGRWTTAVARVALPVGPGDLVVRLCAPRPGGASVRVGFEGRRPVEVHVDGAWTPVVIPMPPGTGRATLVFTTLDPVVPAEGIPGSRDTRRLGVVVGRMEYPAPPEGRGGVAAGAIEATSP